MDPQQIIDILNGIADKLSDPAQHVFDIAVKQVVIEGVYHGIWAFVLILFAPLMLIQLSNRFVKHINEGNGTERLGLTDNDVEGLNFWVPLIARGIAIASFIIGIFETATVLNYLLNPEWQVILKLVSLITGDSK